MGQVTSMHPTYTPRSCNAIRNVVFVGTYLLITAIAALLLLSFTFYHHQQALPRLFFCAGAIVYVTVALLLSRKNWYQTSAYMLLAFYIVLAGGITWRWGINTPIAPLIFGLVIVLAGIMLTARHGLLAALLCGSFLVVMQTAVLMDWHRPVISWTRGASSFGDVFAYCILFSMLALVCWLYKREMEGSLLQAKQAQAALSKQKTNLEVEVRKRTAQLRQAQLEEMQQMYRFAEFGQLGASLLHDLANYLSVLVLEIEGLQSTEHSVDIARTRQVMRYLEELVDSTREKLNGGTLIKDFDIIEKTDATLAFLRYKAAKTRVLINWNPPQEKWRFRGDPTSLAQVITVIASNAIESYESIRLRPASKRRVQVDIARIDSNVVITISNWGKKMSKKEREALFKPFHSTKRRGMGLGLFIAKQIIEMNFGGTLLLSEKTHTEFVITLPREHAE